MNPLLSLLPASKRKGMHARLSQQFAYISSQTGDQRVTSHHSRFTCRYGYGRSAESASMGESGQDFAAVRIHKSVCCFVLCDGVGLSYRGDFAARYLGSSLMGWLEEGRDLSADQLKMYLDRLASAATEELDREPLEHESGLMRSVLEDKRRQGSQSMYICGRIELPNRGTRGRLRLAWQGDSRLRLWNGKEEISELFDHTFSTAERWSTNRGLIGGKPHWYERSIPADMPMRLQVYTDGLSDLDPIREPVPDEQIQVLLDASHTGGLDDDAAFIELQW